MTVGEDQQWGPTAVPPSLTPSILCDTWHAWVGWHWRLWKNGSRMFLKSSCSYDCSFGVMKMLPIYSFSSKLCIALRRWAPEVLQVSSAQCQAGRKVPSLRGLRGECHWFVTGAGYQAITGNGCMEEICAEILWFIMIYHYYCVLLFITYYHLLLYVLSLVFTCYHLSPVLIYYR